MKINIFTGVLPGIFPKRLQPPVNNHLDEHLKDTEEETKEEKVDNMSLQIDREAAAGLEQGGGDATAVEIINALFSLAVHREASDIHLDPAEQGLRARLRVDGVLSDLGLYNLEVAPLIVSRLKILAGMNIAERRLPQDGNIQVQWNDLRVNIRLSTLPTLYGEKVVVRLFSPDKMVIPLDSLGFNPENYQNYLRFLRHTHGLVLLTGPTGCGKTTTLYSTLHYMNNPGRNIITVEDPVEYRLEGINQVQVNAKINLTFARALRHILRQDPNMIMIGEIRDDETAEIATRAALTGHQVFSTLHTNDAPGAVTRLLDMGVEPFLLTSALTGVVAQRLIRLTCPHCREEYTPVEEELSFYENFGECSASNLTFTRGAGCAKCYYTGFRGRIAIHEVMPLDEMLRKLILKASGTEELRRYALSRGMQSLLRDGLNRVREGRTTLHEIMQVAYTV